MKLYRALRDDRLLLALTGLLVVAAWVPLFFTPILPFPDLHNNVAAASMLVDTALERGTLAHYYHVKWTPIPYWTGYAIMAAVNAAFGVLAAAKAIVAVLAVALPLSVMRLLLAVGRSPRLGLWAFALFWDHNLYAGWVTYLLGMALALYALALLIEMETTWDALGVLAWTVLVALTHIQAVALMVVAGAAIAVLGRIRGRSLARYALALCGGGLPAVPWVKHHLFPEGHPTHVPFGFDWHTLTYKAQSLFLYTFDHYPKEPVVNAPACAFAVLLFGPLLLAGAVRQRQVGRDDGTAAAIVMLSCLGLYAALPFEIRGPASHWHNYPRYATFALLTLLLLPRPDLRRWRALLLAPGVVAALAMDVTTLEQFRRFAINARPFLDVFAAVPTGSRVLPLINVETDPTCAYHPYNQFHAYLTAATKSYDPYLFHNDGNPLQYTEGREPPIPRWNVVTDQLSMEKHGGYFDFVLVQGLDRDPFRAGGRLAGARVKSVAEGGIWRLYSIEPPTPHPAGP